MRTFLNRLRHLATITVAAGAVMASVAVPTAHAGIDDYCGTNVAVSNVYTRGCWYRNPENQAWIPSAKFRIPTPLDPNKWTACTLRIAVYQKSSTASSWSRKQTGVGNCLPFFQRNSQNNTAFRMGDIPQSIIPAPKTCYYVIARWFGTYNGQSVGMLTAPYAQSLTLCGPSTNVGVVDESGSDIVAPETPAVDTVTLLPVVEE